MTAACPLPQGPKQAVAAGGDEVRTRTTSRLPGGKKTTQITKKSQQRALFLSQIFCELNSAGSAEAACVCGRVCVKEPRSEKKRENG